MVAFRTFVRRSLFVLEHQSRFGDEWKLLRDGDGSPAPFVFDTLFEATTYMTRHFALHPVRVKTLDFGESAAFLRELENCGFEEVMNGGVRRMKAKEYLKNLS